jgi:plastocyanin
MKKIFHIGLLLSLLLGMFSFAIPASASTAQNFTVLVGAENTTMGVSLMSFYPHTVRIHVGDTITWKSNSSEIHTVTFLAGETLQDVIIPAPPNMASPLQFNPLVVFPTPLTNGEYDGSTYLNSGIMSTDPGFSQTFSLTFTKEGVFPYVCYIHGEMMSGTIEVVGSGVAVPTPALVQSRAKAELQAAWLKVPAVLAKAKAQNVPPIKNPDGTFTHTITVGYESGDVMLMSFFPSHKTVHPGDTVVWKLSSTDTAPHTITFYNGAADQSMVMIAQGQSGPVALVNPVVLFPSQSVLDAKPLDNTDFFNSGLLTPGPHDTFSLKVGDISGTLSYECILHDKSGMVGSLFIVPRGSK